MRNILRKVNPHLRYHAKKLKANGMVGEKRLTPTMPFNPALNKFMDAINNQAQPCTLLLNHVLCKR